MQRVDTALRDEFTYTAQTCIGQTEGQKSKCLSYFRSKCEHLSLPTQTPKKITKEKKCTTRTCYREQTENKSTTSTNVKYHRNVKRGQQDSTN